MLRLLAVTALVAALAFQEGDCSSCKTCAWSRAGRVSCERGFAGPSTEDAQRRKRETPEERRRRPEDCELCRVCTCLPCAHAGRGRALDDESSRRKRSAGETSPSAPPPVWKERAGVEEDRDGPEERRTRPKECECCRICTYVPCGHGGHSRALDDEAESSRRKRSAEEKLVDSKPSVRPAGELDDSGENDVKPVPQTGATGSILAKAQTGATGSMPAKPQTGTAGSMPSKPQTGATGSIPTKPQTGATGSTPANPQTGATGSVPTKPQTGATGSIPAEPQAGATGSIPTEPQTGSTPPQQTGTPSENQGDENGEVGRGRRDRDYDHCFYGVHHSCCDPWCCYDPWCCCCDPCYHSCKTSYRPCNFYVRRGCCCNNWFL